MIYELDFEDDYNYLEEPQQHAQRALAERSNLLENYWNVQFYKRYRFNQEIFLLIYGLVRVRLEHNSPILLDQFLLFYKYV